MKKTYNLSVIVPVYNVEKYIEKCIVSLINQSLENIEIILVDDGSNDQSGEICDLYAKKYRNIKVIHQENQGQGKARNVGLDVAKGKWIGFVDSDDYVDHDFYYELYNQCVEKDLDICVAGRKIFNENMEETYRIDYKKDSIVFFDKIEDYFFSNFFKFTPIVCNKLYKKSIIYDLRFDNVFDVGSEDAVFNFEVMMRIKKYGINSKVFYNNIARNGSTARSYSFGDIKKNYNLLTRVIEKSYGYNFDKNVCYCLYNFFQMRTFSQIKQYSMDHYGDLSKEIDYLFSIKKYYQTCFKMINLKYLRKMGYRITGIISIKLLYILILLRLKFLVKKYIYFFYIK